MTRNGITPEQRESYVRHERFIRSSAAAQAVVAAVSSNMDSDDRQKIHGILVDIFGGLIEGAWWSGFHQSEEEQAALPSERLMELAIACVWQGKGTAEDRKEFSTEAGLYLMSQYGHYGFYHKKAGAP